MLVFITFTTRERNGKAVTVCFSKCIAALLKHNIALQLCQSSLAPCCAVGFCNHTVNSAVIKPTFFSFAR